jgi:hypothetical protein
MGGQGAIFPTVITISINTITIIITVTTTSMAVSSPAVKILGGVLVTVALLQVHKYVLQK